MKLRWTEVKITTGPFPLSQACGRWTRRMSGVRFEDIESQPQVWALICTCAFARLRSSWESTCGLSLPRGVAVMGFGEAQCLQWTAHVLPGLLCVTSESRLLKNKPSSQQAEEIWMNQTSSKSLVILMFFSSQRCPNFLFLLLFFLWMACRLPESSKWTYCWNWQVTQEKRGRLLRWV